MVGYDQGSAYDSLTASGFSVSVVNQTSDEPAGTVVAQDPQSGTKIAKDASKSITIYVSTGPAVEPTPDDSGDQGTTPTDGTDTTNG